jgi:hypothetical protein
MEPANQDVTDRVRGCKRRGSEKERRFHSTSFSGVSSVPNMLLKNHQRFKNMKEKDIPLAVPHPALADRTWLPFFQL